MNRQATFLLICLALLPLRLTAESSLPERAKFYGFTETELHKITGGAILSKDLKEKSDKELAGVVAVFLPKPVPEIANMFLENTTLKSDPSIRSLHVWKPDGTVAGAFATPQLQARYEAYRKGGLRGIGKPGEELALAIRSSLPADAWPGYSEALLNFPAKQLPGMEHRFFAYKQVVEDKPTFILSHRAALKREHDALITEQRYYVSQTYNCRFIAHDCHEVPGGTLVFYVNCTFTDQVAGIGSGLKHSIGRKRMLADVTTNLKRLRDQLSGTSQ